MRAFRRAWFARCPAGNLRRRRGRRIRGAVIGDTPNTAVPIVRNVKRPVWSHRQSGWPVRGLARLFHRAGKAVGEDDERPGGLTVGERLKHHVIAALRLGGAIPRAVESNKGAALITGGKRLAGIDQKIVRRPMAGKSRDRRLLAGAHANFFAVAAIFG